MAASDSAPLPPPRDPVDTVRAAYACFACHDHAGVLALLSPAVEILQTDTLPWGGHYRGYDEACEFFRTLGHYTHGIPTPEQYLPAGRDVVVIGRMVGHICATGAPLDLRIVHVWTVEQGAVTRIAAYVDTTAMRAALAAPPPGDPATE